MDHNYIRVQTEDFNHSELIGMLQDNAQSYGALVTFTGVVRDTFDNDLNSLFLEHYPGMTQKSLLAIIERARERWALGPVAVVHRIGELKNTDNIVFVGVISAHRVAAFEASQFIMDYLKKEAPFWKKENTQRASDWVEQKSTDIAAADQWLEKNND